MHARVDGPWLVPAAEEARALTSQAHAVLGAAIEPFPQLVAACSHCGDIVFAIGSGTWALVDMTTPWLTTGERAAPRVHLFATIAAVAQAMEAHRA